MFLMYVDVDIEVDDVSYECSIKEAMAPSHPYISSSQIRGTTWLMMTCWKLLQLFHLTLSLIEDTMPLAGKANEK